MKVTVIIPAFNEEKYILKAIKSLANQSYDDYEVVIVDNMSTDNTKKIVIDWLTNPNGFGLAYESKDYIFTDVLHSNIVKGVRFTLLTSVQQGTNYAREEGRKFAKGEILAYLDADCIVDYFWIRNGVQQLKNNAAVTGSLYFYDDKNKFRRNVSIFVQNYIYKIISKLLQHFKVGAIILGGNFFVYSKYLNPLNTKLTFYGDDVDIAMSIMNYGKIGFSKKIEVKSSARRFIKQGFFKTNIKYISTFIKSILNKKIETKEIVHPR